MPQRKLHWGMRHALGRLALGRLALRHALERIRRPNPDDRRGAPGRALGRSDPCPFSLRRRRHRHGADRHRRHRRLGLWRALQRFRAQSDRWAGDRRMPDIGGVRARAERLHRHRHLSRPLLFAGARFEADAAWRRPVARRDEKVRRRAGDGSMPQDGRIGARQDLRRIAQRLRRRSRISRRPDRCHRLQRPSLCLSQQARLRPRRRRFRHGDQVRSAKRRCL
jgi:hypothetical protein